VQTRRVSYTVEAGGHRLEALCLAELAELLECALAAGDSIARMRVVEQRSRGLCPAELEQLLFHLAGR